MSAGDALSAGQFRFTYKQVGEHGHRVFAHKTSGEGDPGRQVGQMGWRPNGEISSIDVDPDQRRKGVASGMYAAGRAYADLHGVSEPRHSDDRSPEGDAWAKSVSPANKVPPLWKKKS